MSRTAHKRRPRPHLYYSAWTKSWEVTRPMFWRPHAHSGERTPKMRPYGRVGPHNYSGINKTVERMLERVLIQEQLDEQHATTLNVFESTPDEQRAWAEYNTERPLPKKENLVPVPRRKATVVVEKVTRLAPAPAPKKQTTVPKRSMAAQVKGAFRGMSRKWW